MSELSLRSTAHGRALALAIGDALTNAAPNETQHIPHAALYAAADAALRVTMSEPSLRNTASLAPGSFWLDGGYDRDAVEACPHHPDHHWWTFRLGDVLAPGTCREPDEMMVICRGCFVPRCGHTTDPDPCLLPRHHPEYHRTASGPAEPVGGGDV